jgi:hypothetical protein
MVPIHSTAHAVAHVCRRDGGHQKRAGYRQYHNDGYALCNRFHIVVHRADTVNIHLFNNMPGIIYEKAAGFRGAMLLNARFYQVIIKPRGDEDEYKGVYERPYEPYYTTDGRGRISDIPCSQRVHQRSTHACKRGH